MAKYRRKRQDGVVDAIFCPSGIVGHYGKSLQSKHRPFYFSVQDGALHYWPQDTFEGEYERVEKSRLCVDCGRDRLARVGLGDGRYVCLECDVARQVIKKPKPAHEHVITKHFYGCYECGRDNLRRADVVKDYYPGSSSYRWRCKKCAAKEEKRIKERWYVCTGCGQTMSPKDPMWSPREHIYFCERCWKAAEFSPKTDKPLTLADLKPGDVFQWLWGDPFEPKQLLSRHLYYSPHDRTVWPIYYSDRPIDLVAHYDLTEKQLLWISADSETRKALEDSISMKGLPILRGEREGQASLDCPLCRMFKSITGDSVGDCSSRLAMPCLLKRGNVGGCTGLGYFSEIEFPCDHVSYEGALRFWRNLATFLPNIHPLCLEVEAIPLIWPGKGK